MGVGESFITLWADTPTGGVHRPKAPAYAGKEAMRWKFEPVETGIKVSRLADNSIEHLDGNYDA